MVHFIDPPYYRKAFDLYTNFYTPADHASLARTISELEQPWVLTYDVTPEISSLYPGYDQFQFDLNYTAARKRVGTELLITSSQVDAHGIPGLRPITPTEIPSDGSPTDWREHVRLSPPQTVAP
jgi:DNA adenine methylase